MNSAITSVDPAEKKRQLDSIVNEVADLHPLLKQLLPRLKGVTGVEYTHGTAEKGADFIVSKNDETLNQTTYIGVIAKVGTIKSDNSDVEKQIKECALLDRYIQGGKAKIYLNEIWILTNGHITENAKEKIHAEFKSQNIRFIAGEKLTSLIDGCLPHYWLDVGLEIGHYLSATRIRMGDLENQTNLLQFNGKGQFIEADIYQNDPSNYERKTNKKARNVNLKEEILERRVCIVEGQMGSGKSHLLRHLVSHFSAAETYKKNEWIPVYSDWKNIIDKHDFDLDSLLKSELSKFISNAELNELKFIIFIDGVDELQTSKLAESNGQSDNNSIAGVIEKTKGRANIKVVLASRPMPAISAIARSTATGHYEIQPLSINKIIAFVSSVCRELNISKRIFDDIKKSDLFRQLPQTPIAAILLSKLLAENQKELPSNLTELYAQSIEHMLGRWDIAKGLSTQKEYEASEQICFRLANYLIDNNLPQISSAEALEMAQRYLSDRNLSLDGDKLFSALTKRSGILALSQEAGVVTFRHRSFSEFLYAKSKRSTNALPANNRAFQLYWSNVYFFYIGLWKDCPTFLADILGITPSNEGERWLKIVSMSNYFLAAFSSPYEIVEKNLYKIFIEAAQLYEDILAGKSKTKLASLSEMHLLWLMQMIIRSSYSYGFFKKAIDNVKVQIEDDLSLPPQSKAVAHLMAAVTSMDLGEKNPFDFIIERKDLGEIPLSVSFAIAEESKSLEDQSHSGLLRKRNKKLRQLLSKNKGLAQQLKSKFDTSISSQIKIKSKPAKSKPKILGDGK